MKQTTEHPDGTREVENRYFITSLPWGRLSGNEILDLVRLHWGLENGCHWTMDVVLGEDARPWCTRGKALRMLSWMRRSRERRRAPRGSKSNPSVHQTQPGATPPDFGSSLSYRPRPLPA